MEFNTIKINWIRLTDFRGISEFYTELSPTLTTIYAENGVGKSTICDAILFLFSGKDSSGAKNNNVRPNNRPLEVMPMVEAEIVINDYQKVVLMRGLKANYEKKKKPNVYVGDTTICAIDGVEKKIGEYEDFIQSLIKKVPKDTQKVAIQLLMDSSFLTDKVSKNDEKRSIVLSLFQTESQEEFMARHPEFEGKFKDKPSTISLDQWKVLLTKDGNALEKKKDEVQTRTNENYKNVVTGVIGGKLEEDKKTLEMLKNNIKKVDAAIAKTLNGQEVISATNKFNALVNALHELENKNVSYMQEQKKNLEEEKSKKQLVFHEEKIFLSRKIAQLDNEQLATKDATISLRLKKKSFEKEAKELNKQEWNGAETCPTCNQAIPSKDILLAKGNFNENKVAKLLVIANEIEKCLSDIEEEEKKHNLLLEELNLFQEKLKINMDKIKEIEKDFGVKQSISSVISLLGYDIEKERLEKEKANADKYVKALQESTKPMLKALEDKKKSLLVEEKKVSESIMLETMEQNAKKKANENIALYKIEMDNILVQQSAIMDKISILTDYQKKYYGEITTDLNKNFNGVRFRLFSFYKSTGEFKNEFIILGYDENSKTYQPYDTLNTAQKFKTQLAIVDGISRALGARFIVVADNVEKATNNYIIDNQMLICRAVGQRTKALQIVRDGNQKDYDNVLDNMRYPANITLEQEQEKNIESVEDYFGLM